MSEQAQIERDWIFLGNIGKPIGLDGAAAFHSHSNFIDELPLPLTVHLLPPHTDAGAVAFEITQLKARGRSAFGMRLAGIGDCDTIARWNGWRVYTAEKNLPAPGPDEVYGWQLSGLTVYDAQGREFAGSIAGLAPCGQVTGIADYGAGALLEIRMHNPGKSTLLVPYRRENIAVENLEGGYIVIRDLADWSV